MISCLKVRIAGTLKSRITDSEGRKGSDPDREKGRRNGRKKLFLDRTGRIQAGKSGRHTGRKKHRDRKGRK